MHVAGHTCGTAMCHTARPGVPGCLLASLPAPLRAHVCCQRGTRGCSVGWSPLARTPGNRHAAGRVGRRVGRTPAAGGGFAALPCVGALFGASGEPPCHWGKRHRGTVGVRWGHTWAPSMCRRGHVQHASGSQIQGGAVSLPRGPASLGVHGRNGATCACACAHAGHLLKHGEIFRSPGRRGGRVCAAPAWSVPGAHGSTACVNNPVLF